MARSLLEEKKSGTLVMAKEDLEAHLRRQMEESSNSYHLS